MTRRLLGDPSSVSARPSSSDLLTGSLRARTRELVYLDAELHAKPPRPDDLLRVGALFRTPADDRLAERVAAAAAAAMLAELRARADTLASIGAALGAPVNDVDALLALVSTLAAEALSGVAIVRRVDADGLAEPVVHHHDPAVLHAAKASLAVLPSSVTEVPWSVAATRQALLVGRAHSPRGPDPTDPTDRTDPADCSGWSGWSGWFSAGCATAMAVPILAFGNCLGVLVVYRDASARDYSRTDLAFAQELANRLGLAVHNADLGRRLAAEVRAREQADAHLHYALETQRRLAAGVGAARDDERRRIVEDIHDDPIQAMTFALTQVGRAGLLDADPDRAALLRDAELSISAAIGRLRLMTFQLAPPDLARTGLDAALRLLVAQLFDGTGTHVVVDSDLGDLEPAADQAVAITFRVLREALINARKHAQATTVRVALRRLGHGVHATVTDDGSCVVRPDVVTGVTTGGGSAGDAHLGLTIIANQAAMAGGYARFTAGHGGSMVEMWLPLRLDTERAGR